MIELESYVGKLAYVKRGNCSNDYILFVDDMQRFEGKVFTINEAYFGYSRDLRFYLKGCGFYQFSEEWIVVLGKNDLFLE